MATRHFSPELFAFLRDLADHNERTWFHQNKERYETDVREPALQFIEDYGERLPKLSPYLEANARTVGGSLFRIQRDTRFSKDKTPYKLNSGVHFRHAWAQDAHAPGLYLHLEPRNSFMGMGIWRPQAKVANQIRVHIDENPDRWVEALDAFGDELHLEGESLKRPPRGFDKQHRLLTDLKRKDFLARAGLKQANITKASFIDEFDRLAHRGQPFLGFLSQALEIPF